MLRRCALSLLLLLSMLALAFSQPRMPQLPEMPSGGPGGAEAFNTQQMPGQQQQQQQQQQAGNGQFGAFPGAAPAFGAPASQLGGVGAPNMPGLGGLGQPPAFGPAFGGAGGGAQMGASAGQQQQQQQAAGGAGGAMQAPAASPYGIAPQVFTQDAIQNLQNSYAQRMGYSPLLNQGLTNQMLGGGANFAPQAPAYNPQAFNAQQYGFGAGAGAAAAPQQFNPMQQQQPQQQQQQRMQAFQMPQPAATFSYAMPGQQQQAAAGGYNPTASPAAIAAANAGYNNMLLGLGQGLTNLGRNMAAGPPPAPVAGYAVQQQTQQQGGYRGATLRANYPGIGVVELNVPKVGEGGVSPTLAPEGGATLVNEAGAAIGNAPTVLPMQTETMPTIVENAAERTAA